MFILKLLLFHGWEELITAVDYVAKLGVALVIDWKRTDMVYV